MTTNYTNYTGDIINPIENESNSKPHEKLSIGQVVIFATVCIGLMVYMFVTNFHG